ncbi:MAG: chorismate mutase [Eubacteriales bacterium]|nr:chorismate mutase [Eubacteriales bacterium]
MQRIVGIRGATTTEYNTSDSILKDTRILLKEILEKNDVKNDEIISMIFTVSNDLNAAFPAAAAREMGLTDVPLICTNEINVPGSLEKCIRVLMHTYTDKTRGSINHVYLKNAKKLRPDLVEKQGGIS